MAETKKDAKEQEKEAEMSLHHEIDIKKFEPSQVLLNYWMPIIPNVYDEDDGAGK